MVNFWKQFFLWLLKPSKKSFGIGLMIIQDFMEMMKQYLMSYYMDYIQVKIKQ
ncbi:MAG: hypothetical protein PHG08_00050 [Bacilli bacterium]|nr:hypothetical protein [Bacilli bacterium]